VQLTEIPTEQTTAATDLIIALMAVVAATYLERNGPGRLRGTLWRSVLILLAVAAMLGAAGHGLVLGERTYLALWGVVYLPLALLVAAFLAATIRDLAGDAIARQAIPALVVVALAFFAYMLLDPDNFLPFILYETVAMLLCLAGFIWISIRGKLAGAGWITAAIAVNILAAAVQAEGSLSFTLVWTFDHNGVFHLVQMVSLGLLVWGLKSGAKDWSNQGSSSGPPRQNKTPP
jgi:hypothetical protein